LNYLEEASQKFRANAAVKISHPGKTNPLGIVEFAVKEKSNYEYIYCVLDRDEHEKWEESHTLANIHGIKIISSYPCYEFWLMLHFKYSRKSYMRQGDKSPADALSADLKKIDEFKEYKKGESKGLFYKLEDKLATATKHANRCLKEIAKDPEALNPSTTIHHLLNDFEKIGSQA